MDELDRKVALSKKCLAMLRDPEEQTRVVIDFSKQRISSVGTASATLVEKAVGPKKPCFARHF